MSPHPPNLPDLLHPNSHSFFSKDTFLSPLTFSRQGLARLAWMAEVLTLALTGIYTLIVFYDVYVGGGLGGVPVLVDAAWHRDGFCVWTGDGKPFVKQHGDINKGTNKGGSDSWWDSHSASFVGDQILGVPLNLVTAYYVWWSWADQGRKGTWLSHHKTILLMTLFGNLFVNLHGLAHLSIHGMPGHVDSPPEKFFGLDNFQRTVGAFVFMAGLPWLANSLFNMPLKWALLLHGAFALYLPWNPPHYGFGIVQALINIWFCFPRAGWMGTGEPAAPESLKTAEDAKQDLLRREREISQRVDGGLFLNSLLFPCLMVIPFLELLQCGSWFGAVGGHFWYDTSTVVAAYLISWEVFKGVKEVDGAGKGKKDGEKGEEEPYEGYKRWWYRRLVEDGGEGVELAKVKKEE